VAGAQILFFRQLLQPGEAPAVAETVVQVVQVAEVDEAAVVAAQATLQMFLPLKEIMVVVGAHLLVLVEVVQEPTEVMHPGLT
jgi:hypothetical protein